MSWTEIAFWVVAPYLTLVLLVGGLIWRHRYDRFGWTTRSSELYESRLLRIGSPLFHFGLLFVIIGHVFGLVIPESWTSAAGLSEAAYHAAALAVGGVAGFCTLAGIALLIYRRRTTGPVFMATTKNDKMMYVVLVAALLAGLMTTVLSAAFQAHDYRRTVSPWFRGIFYLQPDAGAMVRAPWTFKLHTLVGMLLIALFPFTRLVHAFAAPVGYLFRPYVVYRSRAATDRQAVRAPRPGWDR
ncbi:MULTISPECIES: respiratory nitrate reductase subunit gamma [Streptosporangium]|uniref:Nitrate reductase gamma subunit n=1 Tax=Streptosporangium brasiliense TaxID=47480 RepID=A0ABT9QWU9_9ACTN|nr:respiratory nitrate reductase subunit gamma [Streptosporangium brasiliense]MDP9861004.1 nitrate reductase gamma subunit [Streptosporangium brasiliense]